MTGRALLGTAALLVMLGVSGCNSSEPYTPSSYPVPPAADPVTTTTPPKPKPTKPKPKPTQPEVQRPEGAPPRGVLGAWQGGPGAAGGYTLKVTRTGEYQLIHHRTTGFPKFVEEGYIVGDADELLFRPVVVDGIRTRERVATWQSLPNSVTELITIADPLFGDFDMVRDDS